MNAKAEAFLAVSVAMIMLAMGLGLTTGDFRRIRKTPRAVAVGMLGQLVCLPLLAFLVAKAFVMPPALAVGLVLIAACPGGAHSNLFASFAKADAALSVTLTALSGVLTIVTIPLIVSLAVAIFATGEVPPVPVGKSMLQVLVLMGVPVALGMLLRAKVERVALRLATPVKVVATLILLLIIVGSVAKNAAGMGALIVSSGGPVVVLNLGAMLVGGVLARGAGLGVPQQLTIVLEVGIQNGTLAYALALGVTGDHALLPPIIVYSLLVYATGLGVVVVGRRLSPSGDLSKQPQ